MGDQLHSRRLSLSTVGSQQSFPHWIQLLIIPTGVNVVPGHTGRPMKTTTCDVVVLSGSLRIDKECVLSGCIKQERSGGCSERGAGSSGGLSPFY
jgi:hypothetical protein